MENKIINPINQKIVTNTKPIQQEQKKQKTSSKVIKGISVAAGIGITALAVGGLMYKHKVFSPNILKVEGDIDFKEAKTLKEAIEYGVKKLGIKNYKGFNEKDLDVVNWINEGLTNCANKAKAKGQIVMPKKIIYTCSPYKHFTAGVNKIWDMEIYKNQLTAVKEGAKTLIKRSTYTKAEQDKIIKNLTIKDAFEDVILVAKDRNINLDFSLDEAFSIISHEMGHLQHRNNLKSLSSFYSLGNSSQRPEKLAKGAKELLNLFESKKNTTVSKVSTYAKESPLEFVAEVFSKLSSGIKLDDDVMDLYKKLGGVLFN